ERWLDDGQIHLPRRTDGRFESEPSKGCLLIHVVSGMPKVVRSTAGSTGSNPMVTLHTVDFLCGREVGASTSSASRRSMSWSETRHVIYRWKGLDVISTTVHYMNMIRYIPTKQDGVRHKLAGKPIQHSSGTNSYHYSNSNGSYYYRNDNGSTYYNSGNGSSTYTSPSGYSYTSSTKK
ncbi:hypothetical protein THAOC_28946, partial [Thalassiosira oceanica]